jgi:hypothetical protein
MPGELELMLDPNGDEVKLTWHKGNGPWSRPLKLPSALLSHRSRDLRAALGALNAYMRSNHDFMEERDPGWQNYRGVLKELQQHGAALYNALFDESDLRAQVLSQALQSLNDGAELRVHCSDEVVSLPLGFVFEGDPLPLSGRPSRADFSGFWLNRFNITMLVRGGGVEQEFLGVDPRSLRALYALHRTEVEDAWPHLGNDSAKLKRLTGLPIKDYYDWDSARQACASICDADTIVFILAHSDGDWLELANKSKIDCQGFARMLHKGRRESHPVLLVLNCCLSATGGEGRSLLSAIAQPGFCGLIGTEAEILNSYALRCGTCLMWELCANGLTLGEAFDRMQRAEDLFPLNLFYTCYAERDFRLKGPIDELQGQLEAA